MVCLLEGWQILRNPRPVVIPDLCFNIFQCLVASVVISFRGYCVISIFVCTPHPYWRHFFWSGRHISESVIFISFDPFGIGILTYRLLCPVFIQLICWNQQFGLELWHLKTCLSPFTTCRNQCLRGWVKVPVKIATTYLYLLFPFASPVTESRKVHGFSKCTATTYFAHQD